MSNIPSDLRYSHQDEWVREEGDESVVGITDYAQHALGDIVYIELPQVGTKVSAGGSFGVIESVKASSELYAPIGGEIVAVNTALEGDQSPINEDPYGAGWMVRIKPDGSSEELLDAAAYTVYCAGRE